MANKTAILSVKIVSDAKEFRNGMKTAETGLDKFKSKMDKLKLPATAILGGLALIGKGTFKLASEAEQNFGAVDAVFKGHADKVHEMAKTTSKSLGVSGSDYEKFSALMGSQLKNAGVPIDELAGKTDGLIRIGADFAAQFGGTNVEAIEAISSALKGEMDPIEKYGISLNEAKIKAQMMADGTDKLTGAAYDAAKAQAILSLINSQGADSMGANGREANTAAGTLARLTAIGEDLGAKFGQALLPIVSGFADALMRVADWASQNTGLITGLAVGLGALAAVVLLVNGAIAVISATMAIWRAAVVVATAIQWAWNAALLANPIGLVIIAVALLVAIIVRIATKTQFFQTVWGAMVNFAKSVWASMTAAVQARFSGVVSALVGLIGRIRAKFSSVVSTVRNIWNAGFGYLRSRASSVINGVVGFINRIVGAARNAMSWVRNLFNMGGMPGWLKSVLGMGGTGLNVTGELGIVQGFGTGATGGIVMPRNTAPRVQAPQVTNVNVTINGALDPIAVGKQVQDVLNKYNRSQGRKVGALG